jgi:hypothetical protein
MRGSLRGKAQFPVPVALAPCCTTTDVRSAKRGGNAPRTTTLIRNKDVRLASLTGSEWIVILQKKGFFLVFEFQFT